MASIPMSARAVDLGALATARQNEQKAAAAKANAPAGVVIDVTTASFQTDVIERSRTIPVVIDLWADWCGPCKQLSPVLERLAAEYGGRWILAKVDVDAEQQIAAAFQVQSIPSVFAVVGGAPVPLFQGALPEPQIRQVLDELLRVAAEEGVSGTLAEEPAEEDPDEPVEVPVDPRFEAAYDAIEAGDWAAAEKAYRAVLAAEPADQDAQAGLATVGLYARTDGRTAPSIDDATDPADRLLAADFAALGNDWPTAFDLAIAVVRVTSGDEREAARQRVLDFFLLAGDDPSVPKARSALANALF